MALEDRKARLTRWEPEEVIFSPIDAMMLRPESELYLRITARHVAVRNESRRLLETFCTVHGQRSE